MVQVFDWYNRFDIQLSEFKRLNWFCGGLPLKRRTLVPILTLLNLFRGSQSEGFSPVLSIIKSFNFSFSTFFQIQKPLGSIQKIGSNFMYTLHILQMLKIA